MHFDIVNLEKMCPDFLPRRPGERRVERHQPESAPLRLILEAQPAHIRSAMVPVGSVLASVPLPRFRAAGRSSAGWFGCDGGDCVLPPSGSFFFGSGSPPPLPGF